MASSNHAKSEVRPRSEGACASGQAPRSQRGKPAQPPQNGHHEVSSGGSFWSLSGAWHS